METYCKCTAWTSPEQAPNHLNKVVVDKAQTFPAGRQQGPSLDLPDTSGQSVV